MLFSAVTTGELDIVNYHVELGLRNNFEWRALYLHRRHDVFEGVELKGHFGRSVLFAALDADALEMVRYLVEKGADVNTRNTNGETVLHAAVDADAFRTVKYLVEQGADITLKNKISVHSLGIYILKMAVKNNSVALVNFLLQKNIAVWRAGTFLVEGRQMSLLEWSVHLGHDEIATILKRSVKHRETIQMLKARNSNQLKEVIM